MRLPAKDMYDHTGVELFEIQHRQRDRIDGKGRRQYRRADSKPQYQEMIYSTGRVKTLLASLWSPLT